jgi:hypothetical protein
MHSVFLIKSGVTTPNSKALGAPCKIRSKSTGGAAATDFGERGCQGGAVLSMTAVGHSSVVVVPMPPLAATDFRIQSDPH